MRNIIKIRRSIKAISPVISILLMIAIAVVASIVAYAWVMGYIGFQTEKAGNEIQIQSYSSGGNLVIYVQNTGQGVVHLKQDGSVYVNDVLKGIVNIDNIAVASGAKIPIAMGQTVKVEVDYQHFQAGDKIKVVTVEGTVIDFSGHNSGSGSSSGGSNGPSAGFIYTGTPVINNQITFTDKSLPGKAAITSWLWDFDGTTKTTQNTTYSYDTAGEKTISLTVTDANGRTSKATLILNIATTTPTVTSPIAEFTITNIEPIVNQNVPFKDASTAGSGTINHWSWTFGDGGVSSEQNPIHAYSTSGTKTVTLTVTDSNTKTSTVSHTLTVIAPTPTPTTPVNPTTNPSKSPDPSVPPAGDIVNIAFAVSPANTGVVTADKNAPYYKNDVIGIAATPNAGYVFSEWTVESNEGTIVIDSTKNANAQATLLSSGTIKANFVPVSKDKLVFTNAGSSVISEQNVERNLAFELKIQRQTPTNSPTTSGGQITAALSSTSSNGKFYNNQLCRAQDEITQTTIASGSSSSQSFWYKDSSLSSTATLTATNTNYADAHATFRINMLFSTFEGVDDVNSANYWLKGWTAGSQPPWYQGVGIGVDDTSCIMSTTARPQGDGAFSSSVLNTAGANTITITFQYRLVNTDSRDTFELAYSTAEHPVYDGRSTNYFTYYDQISTTQNVGQWQTYTHTFNNYDSDYFTFRLWTDLYTPNLGGSRSPTAEILVDNVIVTVA